MSDDAKPKASFLGGKKAAPAPASPPAEQPSPQPAAAPAGGKPGFLGGRAAAPAAAPAQAAPAAAPVIAPQPAAAPAAPVQGNRALAQQYLDRGLNHYDRQEIEEAFNAYQQCVQADPSFHLGFNNLGMVLIDLERYDEALEALYNSVRCDPNYGEAYNNLGFVLRRMQRSVEAAAAYGMYLKLESDVEEAPRIQAWMQTVMQENNLPQLPPFTVPPKPGQAAPAAAAPAPAAAEPPKIKKMAAWEVAAGDVATAAPVSALGEIDAGAAPAEAAPVAAAAPVQPAPAQPVPANVFAKAAAPAKAATAAPSQPPPTVQPARPGGMKPVGPGNIAGKSTAVVEKGMDKFAEGNLDEAAKLFQQATEIEPDNPEGHIGLAKVWLRQDRMEEAVELLQKAVALDQKEPAGYYVLGFALRSLDRQAEAAEAYEVFLKLMPEAVDAPKMKQWVSQVKTSLGLTDQDDVEDTEEIVTPSDEQYKAALDVFRGGDIDTALRESIRILTEDPGHARTRVLLGRCYLRQKAFDQAYEQFENSLVSRPDYPEGLYYLGFAAERKMNREKAIESYKRYLEVAPTGPRAEKLEAWMTAQGGSGAGDPNQQQCELCLRYFAKTDITMNEGKATCRNCMAVMGGTGELGGTLQDPATMGRILPALHDEEEEVEEEVPKKKGKGVLVLAALALIVAGAAGAFYLGKLDPILIKVGLKKKPIDKKQIDPTDKKGDLPPAITFDPSQVKIANKPQNIVYPYTPWVYKPALDGLNTIDQYAPNWTKEYSLKNEPKGMTVNKDTGEINWAYSPEDYKAIKSGVTFNVELVVKATGKGPDGAQKELFTVIKPMALYCQLGYELGPELDLGLGAGEKPSLGIGEFNGDDLSDLVIASGRFRAGSLREYVQRKDNPLPAPTVLMRDSRFSALQVGDLDGDKKDDLIAADWQRGRLRLFYQQANELIRKDEVPIGAGPIALGVGDMGGDKSLEVAALLGSAGSMAITTISAEGKFGAVNNIKMPGIGAKGSVLPWNSAQAGTGFVAVTPLAESPIQFVAWNKGEWDKAGKGTIKSSLESSSVITDAIAISAGGGKKLLAVIVSGRNNQVLLMQENGGQFSQTDASIALPGIGLGLAAHDFNRDGRDDLIVVMADEAQIFLSHGAQYEPALKFQKLPRMLGPIVRFGSMKAERPDFLLVSETRKAHILKAQIVEAPPEPAPPVEVKKEPEAEKPAPAAAGSETPKDAAPAPEPATKK